LYLAPPAFVWASQPHPNGKAAFKEVGVRVMSIWWRWGESNPCPKAAYTGFLRAYPAFSIYLPGAPAGGLTRQGAFGSWPG